MALPWGPTLAAARRLGNAGAAGTDAAQTSARADAALSCSSMQVTDTEPRIMGCFFSAYLLLDGTMDGTGKSHRYKPVHSRTVNRLECL